jgi:hypothetical protein
MKRLREMFRQTSKHSSQQIVKQILSLLIVSTIYYNKYEQY